MLNLNRGENIAHQISKLAGKIRNIIPNEWVFSWECDELSMMYCFTFSNNMDGQSFEIPITFEVLEKSQTLNLEKALTDRLKEHLGRKRLT